ncbi:DUF1820 family protein [Sedimenticola selenatireducens]|uniref:DUF1820 domain-containing protein n=1 Tax=Sedimenticola selenatireducens TaxID=191960 RepID=A0A2N6CSI5_9GAMM|nr:DUF1820 family protein [Sedimenticola selenatireducens]PLX60059.1 MAG: DUF1820 domain-containing protein [Sedimenticola selenatireducens]
MHIFRISFINQAKVYQLYAESVKQAEVFGFLEIRNLIFGETSSVVIDPAEEKLKAEFGGVSRTLIPMHAVIRVDEVEKRGQCKIMELDGNANITPFPNSWFRPDKGADS